MTPDLPSDPEVRRIELSAGPATYTDVGAGPVLVAIHGAPGSVRDWRWLGPVVEPHLRFVRVDLPGHGGTPVATAPGRTPADRAAYVVELLDALGIQRFAAMGHSLGGSVAIALGERPQALGVALVASVGLRVHRGFRQGRPRIVSSLLGAPVLGRSLLPWLREGFARAGFPKGLSDAEMVHSMHTAGALRWPEQRRGVGALSRPTLVAWTEDDRLIDADISRQLAAACPEGPRLALGEGGHNLQKTRAVELGEALVAFVRSCHEAATPR